VLSSYKELNVWKRAYALCLSTYHATKGFQVRVYVWSVRFGVRHARFRPTSPRDTAGTLPQSTSGPYESPMGRYASRDAADACDRPQVHSCG